VICGFESAIAAQAAKSDISQRADEPVFTINGDGSYSFHGASFGEPTLKAHLAIQAAVFPQPTLRIMLNRSGDQAAVEKSLQILKVDATNAGIREVVVDN
jgi:hypothetical protein